MHQFAVNAAEAAVRHDQHDVTLTLFTNDRLDNRLDVVEMSSRAACGREIGHQSIDGQPLVLRQAGSIHARDDGLVGADEGPREVLLEHSAARGRRTWLEYRRERAPRGCGTH